jgi:hypothetical protein
MDRDERNADAASVGVGFASARSHIVRNHPAWGLVCDWMLRYVAGIRAIKPGYGRVKVAPVVPKWVGWVEAEMRTIRVLDTAMVETEDPLLRGIPMSPMHAWTLKALETGTVPATVPRLASPGRIN